MNKLTQIEAERVIAVLDDSFQKLSDLSYVQLDLIPQPEMLAPLLDGNEEIAHLLIDQKSLEDHFEDLLSQSREAKGVSRGKVRDELKKIIEDLKDSTRNLARVLKDHPEISKRLQSILNEVPGSAEARSYFTKFLSCFYDLRDLSQDKLQTTVEQERDKNKKLDDIDSKAKKVSLDKSNLEKELQAERLKHETEARILDDTIHKLDLELQELTTRYQGARKHLDHLRATQSEQDRIQHESNVRQLEEQRKKREQELTNQSATHRTEEKEIRNKKRINEEQIEHHIRNYEKIIQEKQAEFDAKKKMVADNIKAIEDLALQEHELGRTNRLVRYRKRDEEAKEKEKKDQDAAFFRSVAILQNLFRRRRDTKFVEALRRKRGRSRRGKGGKKGKKKG